MLDSLVFETPISNLLRYANRLSNLLEVGVLDY